MPSRPPVRSRSIIASVKAARAGLAVAARDLAGGRPGRRAVAIVCVAVLLIFAVAPFTGCPIRLARPGVTLTIWDGPRWADEGGNRYHWIKKKIAEFEAAHPFVEVVLVPVEWNDLRGLLDAAKEAGRFPDVAPFDLSAGGVTFEEVKAGLLEPVDDFITAADDLSPEAKAAYTYDGHLWGFPSTMTGHALLLNLDLFAKRGVTPPADGKWSWAEFRDACRKLTFDSNGDGKTDVWGFGAYVLPGYYETWPFLYADGARPLSGDFQSYTLNSPAGVAALKRLTDLVFVDKAAHPMTGSAAVRNVFDVFANKDKQQVAIAPWSAWAIDYLKTQDNVIKNFAVVEYPTGATGAAVTIGGTSGFVAFRQQDTYKRGLAMALANYLTNANSQYELARGYHAFPSRQRALDLDPFAGDPAYQRASRIIFHAVSLPSQPRWPDLERIIQREVQMALLGIKGPKEALDDAGAVITTFLAETSQPAGGASEGASPGASEGASPGASEGASPGATPGSTPGSTPGGG